MRAVSDIPAPARAATRSVTLVRHGVRPVMLAGLVVVAATAGAGGVACSRADAPAVGADAAVEPDAVVEADDAASLQSPAPPLELSSPEHQRYQRLRLETLRAMIEAAKLALPIGPFQERIDAAAIIALEDVSEAADRMEVIVVDLQEAIAAAGR